MDELNEKVIKAIEENLPKQMGEVLQKRLLTLEKAERDLKDLQDLYKNVQKELSESKIEANKLKGDLAIKDDLLKNIAEREKKLFERELKIEVNELKYKLSETEKRSNEMKELVGIVFKSPVYKESISKSFNTLSEWDTQKQKHEYRVVGEISEKTTETE